MKNLNYKYHTTPGATVPKREIKNEKLQGNE